MAYNIAVFDGNNNKLISFCESDKLKARDWIRGLTRGYICEWDYDLDTLNKHEITLVHPDGHERRLRVEAC